MKTILSVILLAATTMLMAQNHQYKVIKQDEFGLLKCTYIQAVSGNTGDTLYNAVISFRNMDWYVDTSEISLPSPALREQFRTDLKASIDYLVLKKKDKSQLVKTNNYYSLVIHDFPNTIYMYSPDMGYTVMTIREAKALFVWLSDLE